MILLTDADVLAAPCPTCRAPAGQWCDPRTHYVHMSRFRAAEREAQTQARALPRKGTD